MLDQIEVFSNNNKNISFEQVREDSENREWSEHPNLRVHPLRSVGRNLSDEKVAEYFGSKESLIHRSIRDATEVFKKGLFGGKMDCEL